MTKRILALALALLLTLSLCGCDRDMRPYNTANFPNDVDLPQPNMNLMMVHDSDLNYYTRQYYNSGSCKMLRSKVAVFVHFVNDYESMWSMSDMASSVGNSIIPALEFIEAQAEKWDVNVSFDVDLGERYSFDGVIEADGDCTTVLLKRLAEKLGYGSAIEYNDALKKETNSQIVHLFMVNKTGRSAAIVADLVSEEFCESAVVLRTGDSEYDIYSVAHEILHLFGAEDMYEGEREELGRMFYSDDIMYDYDSPKYMEISNITAYQIGWIDEAPAVCYDSRWVTYYGLTEFPYDKFDKDPYDSTETEKEPIALPEELTQRLDFEPIIDEMRPTYSEGTNGKLEGKLAIVCIFADDTVSEWDRKDAVDYAKNYIEPVASFLEEQAARYGIELEVEVKKEYADVGFELKTKSDEYFQIKALAQYKGYDNEWEMYTAFRERYDANVAFLVIPNKAGTPNNMISSATYRSSTGIFLTEYAMLYSEYDGYDLATMATREILYLYGGQNTYSPADRKEIARQVYPDDIMLYDTDNLYEAEISEVTAFNLGWIDNPPEEMYYRAWWSESQIERMRTTDLRHE